MAFDGLTLCNQGHQDSQLMHISYTEVIEKLQLEPLDQEGGFFRRTYQSVETVNLREGYEQHLGTAIYFLLTPDAFSALHWLEDDELYHFYIGDPVELYELDSKTGLKQTVLGHNIMNGQQVQYPVRGKRWHGSRLVSGGQWALLGTTMAPGFAWDEFKLGKRDALIHDFPEHRTIIESLTRPEDGHQ